MSDGGREKQQPLAGVRLFFLDPLTRVARMGEDHSETIPSFATTAKKYMAFPGEDLRPWRSAYTRI
jgi:hypothetical protein